MDMRTWKESRARAETAVSALQTALAEIGLPERALRSIRPVVTRSGGAYVELGMLRPDIVEQIAKALGQPPSRPHPPGPMGMRWLDTGSGSGAMVPVPITQPGAPGGQPIAASWP